MYVKFSTSPLCWVPFCMCLQFYFMLLSEVQIKQVFMLVVYFDQRLSVCEIWFWPRFDCPGYCKLYHIVHQNHWALLSSVTTGSIIPFTPKCSDSTLCISITALHCWYTNAPDNIHISWLHKSQCEFNCCIGDNGSFNQILPLIALCHVPKYLALH
jgi:hypothetical protein